LRRATHLRKCKPLLSILSAAFLWILCLPAPSHATFTEQLVISTKSVSLANSVVASPPGVMSVHHNPAGLSNQPEGPFIGQSFFLPYQHHTVNFDADEDFEGFMNTWGPQEGQIPDPIAGESDSNSSGLLYLPIYDDTVNFLAGAGGGISYRKPGSKWTFAVANYAPWAGGEAWKTNSPVRYIAEEHWQQHLIYAAPAVSYQLTPTFSVGLAVGAGQTSQGTLVDQRSPNELVALTRTLGNATEELYIPIVSDLTLPNPWMGGGIGPYDKVGTLDFDCRDDFSPNYNVGILWQPKEWFSFGAVYQSEINAHMGGSYTMEYTETFQNVVGWLGSSPLTLMTAGMLDLPTTPVPYQTGNVKMDLTLPRRVELGFMIKPTKRLRLELDLHWNDYSVQPDQSVEFDQRLQLLRQVRLLGYTEGTDKIVLQQDWEDTIHGSLGVEYQLNDMLTLRGGYAWRPTSAQHEYADLNPNTIPDLHWIGTGLGITLENNHQIDIALAWLVSQHEDIDNNQSSNLNSTKFYEPVYNPYAGLDVEHQMQLYIASIGMSMPFADFIEMQKDMMHHQQEAIHKVIHLLKKPFSFIGHDE